ncbi:MAG: MotA/TolQ/ExbB proton channel family protein [Pseudomonadales bacterium]|uniref:MotA/TolQ/ExbB proton channel n=1 Tax=Oleiphilus messinensis TaxID=141451 RepID=A0A1Y0I1M8_9GAMM|nr:MotA/TolQ/ExbB proton channel family protein [Oleiphilus messinensis]ARU54352.1 MotA/TolQ/ExbB proton channel [Oleiphilus messinensis]MCG8610284.1 MotA/TolQ/ExbB proton channel family protein [Pseudomonadales bacterium]
MNIFLEQGTLMEYVQMGGFVMPPLVLTSVVLWYALVYRLLTIRKGRLSPRELVRKGQKGEITENSITARAAVFALQQAERIQDRQALKSIVKEQFSELRLEIARHKKLVRSLVAVAPLLGLLGTVDGMIETFDSLADMALFSQSGGIAGGISKALFTTQMGLAVSIPGLLLGRVIERKERNIYRELDQIRDLVCANSTATINR